MKLRYASHLLVPLAVGAIVLAACGSSSGKGASGGSTTTTTGAGSTTTAAPATGSLTVSVGSTSLGDTLVDARGRTLYAFKVDTNGKSMCNAGCDTTWPALTVSGKVKLGTGLDAGDFKTIMRDDGKTQVTDYGQPLYTYSGDSKSGDTNGNGIGNVWYAVNKEGKPASGAATAPTTTTTAKPGY
jgi:predicted lipoprotein with Yx(FWY)xxD motif